MGTELTLHHITLTVTDLAASADWYEAVLGLSKAAHREGPGWQRILMRSDAGLVIGLTQHDGTAEADRFDERRVGLDHISLACDSLETIEQWQTLLDEMGVPHGGIVSAPHAHVLTCRDPDNLPVEFFCPI